MLSNLKTFYQKQFGNSAKAAQPPQQSAPTSDAAWSESSMYRGSDIPKYNPDALLSRKGLGVYLKMMTDEQVKAVVRFKRDAITSREFFFCCDHEELSEEDQKLRIEIFNYAIDRMGGTFTDAVNGVMSAMYNGYSLTEKIFQKIEFRGKTWIGIKRLKLRPCDTFFFHVDEFGNVEKLVQKFNGKEQSLDLSQFIHYVQNPDWDEHYGRSELHECYRAWFSKDITLRFQNIHLERFAAGFVWAQARDGKTLIAGSQEEANLKLALSNIQAKTAILMPSMMELHIEHPDSTDAYERAVAQHDKAIAKALLVPNLLGITEQGNTGSFAQSETQLEAFLWTLDADAKRLEDALNEQLFREIGDYNFGDNLYPYFKFRPVSDKKQMEVIKLWTALVTGRAVQASDTDENHLRELLEFPEKGESLAVPPEPTTPTGGGDPAPASPMPAAPPAKPAPMEETVVGKQAISVSAFSRAMKRVDFAVIANKADNSIEDAVLEIATINSAAVARLVALAGELKLGTADGNPADVQKIQFRADEMSLLKSAITKGLKDAWAIGESHARREIQKAQFGRARFGFDPDQPRDEDGKWGDGGGSGGLSTTSETYKNQASQWVHPGSGEKRIYINGHDAGSGVKVWIKKGGEDSDKKDSWDAGIKYDGDYLPTSAASVRAGSNRPHDVALTAAESHMEKHGLDSRKVSFNDLWNNAKPAKKFERESEIEQFSRGTDFKTNDLALQDVAAAYLKTKAYTLAGDISGATQKTIRNILLEGIKVSKTTAEVKQAIYKALLSDGMLDAASAAELLDLPEITVKNARAHRIETAIKTVSFEAINEARYSFFSDPALDGFVEALEYSAILDDRTTEICSQLNGETYGIDDAVWSTFRPPNHFNCRSILIPVTIRDTWSRSDDPGGNPQKGFGFTRSS